MEEQGKRGEPICVSTLSSHCRGPFKCSSIQHGVEVTVCRRYSAPQPFTKLIRIVHIRVSWYTASKPCDTDCDNNAANSWLLKIFRLHPASKRQPNDVRRANRESLEQYLTFLSGRGKKMRFTNQTIDTKRKVKPSSNPRARASSAVNETKSLVTWRYLANGSRMPAVTLIAIGTLHKDARVGQALRKHFTANVI